ncbi:MAG: aminopeptidase P family protein [Bradymonadia bacterium]
MHRASAALVEACARRRRAFADRLGGHSALVPAGAAAPRNYPANTWPYRPSSHFWYLIGEGVEGAWLIVDPSGATLYARAPDADDALWHGPTEPLDALAERLGLPVRPLEALPAAVSERTLGVLAAQDPVTTARTLELVPTAEPEANAAVAQAMIDTRLVHDAQAIAGLTEAAEATVAAHVAGMSATRPGMGEWVVTAEMVAALGRRRCTTSYGPIVSVHGEVLHNHHHDNIMQAGDLLLVDVGAETADGWAGDVTRTWPVSGQFSPTQKAIYEVVLASQLAAIDTARVGVRYRDVHLEAARVLTAGLVDLGILKGDVDTLVADDVHALFFPHGVGHLLGLDVHDMEDLGDAAGYAAGRVRSDRFGLGFLRLDRDLQAGMAVTIEPGFYQVPAILNDAARTAIAGDRLDRTVLAKFADVRGIRIEDDILIQAAGAPKVLTAGAPKTVGDVETAVGQ